MNLMCQTFNELKLTCGFQKCEMCNLLQANIRLADEESLRIP